MASHGHNESSDSENLRIFFEKFAATVNIKDPLPVKVGSHTIRKEELDGEIIDWTVQYLQQKNCPSHLLYYLTRKILKEVRQLILSDETDGAITDEKGFEPVKLMQLATSKINHTCLDYVNNQRFENLCKELSLNSQMHHKVSVHAIRNGRRKMEDRHVILQDLNTVCSLKDDVLTSYYAIFDGHAGTDAAFYAASQLNKNLVRHKNFPQDCATALKDAFIETDDCFINKHENEKLKGGTTAVVALIRGCNLFIAWLGDSQAVLVREGHGVQLVEPHKPDRSDEKERISAMGGEVMYWDGAFRVNGQLAVSRAIGDASYKPYVTAEPDVTSITLDGTEDFLVIGCDGLWDAVTENEAAFLVHQHLHHNKDVTEVSGRLVQVAKKKGSTDNITVIVVFLRDPALIAKRPLPPAPVTPPPSAQATPTIEQQRKAFEAMAAELGWSGSDNDNSWQQNPDAQDPFNSNGMGSPLSSDDKAAPNQPDWTEGCSQFPADMLSGGGVGAGQDDVDQVLRPNTSGFHLSSDGSTWDQTSNTNAPGVDWNQFDDENNGQPSLVCWDGSQAASSVSGDEQIISPIEDLTERPSRAVDHADAHCRDYEAGVDPNQMWASEENSVKFPPFSTAADDQQGAEQSIRDVADSSSSTLLETTSDHGQPDECGDQQLETLGLSSGQMAEVGLSATADQDYATQPDFQWNLHAPEFEFGSSQPARTEENQLPSAAQPPPTNTTTDDLMADQTTVQELLDFDCLSSAPIPPEGVKISQTESGSALVELVEAEEPSGPRKLSATELLVKSASDAELAVILAAVNDEPDEIDPTDPNEPLDQGFNSRLDNLDDHQAFSNESKGDGAVEADDSDDEDWTFYRNKGDDKEDSAMENEATDSSLMKMVDLATKAEEVCVSNTCQAIQLGDQLEKLVVVDQNGTEELAHDSHEISNPTNHEVVGKLVQEKEAQKTEGEVASGAEALLEPEVQVRPVAEVEEKPVLEVEEEPVIEVEKEPVLEVEKEPILEVEKEPIPEVEKEPVLEVEKEPIPEVELKPMPEVEPESVPEVAPEPVLLVEADTEAPEAQTQPVAEPKAQVSLEPEVQESLEPKVQASLEFEEQVPESEGTIESKAELITENMAHAETEPEAQQTPEPMTQVALEPEAQIVLVHDTVAETRSVVHSQPELEVQAPETDQAADPEPTTLCEAPETEAQPELEITSQPSQEVEQQQGMEPKEIFEPEPAAETKTMVEAVHQLASPNSHKDQATVEIFENRNIDAQAAAPIANPIRDLNSPVSDTGATVGSDILVAPEVKLATRKSSVKKPITSANKSPITTSAKTASPKEPSRRPINVEVKKTDVKPTRPTKLSPLRKAAPAPVTAKINLAPKAAAPKPTVPKSAIQKVAAPQVTAPKVAALKVASMRPVAPKPATSKLATPNPSTPKSTSTGPAPSRPPTTSGSTRIGFNAARPTAATTAKKLAPSGSAERAPTTSATSKVTSTRPVTSAPSRTISSVSSTAARKVAPTKTQGATSRLTISASTKSSLNGDAKVRVNSLAARTSTKPLVNGASTINGRTKAPGAPSTSVTARPAPTKTSTTRAVPTKTLTGSTATKTNATPTGTRPASKPAASASTPAKLDA